jgi:hypothetical protein
MPHLLDTEKESFVWTGEIFLYKPFNQVIPGAALICHSRRMNHTSFVKVNKAMLNAKYLISFHLFERYRTDTKPTNRWTDGQQGA